MTAAIRPPFLFEVEVDTKSRVSIVPMTPDHWPDVRRIYLEGIATGNATFEIDAPEWEAWDAAHAPSPRLIALVDGRVAGWAALSPYSRRRAYSGVGEVSVYVAAESRGQGVGISLLRSLVEGSEEAGFWTLQAGIFPENSASLRIHEQCGFRLVGRRDRIGRIGSAWRDVLLLERRSGKV